MKNNDDAGREARPQPSAELVSYRSSGRARFFTVQAQAAAGTANDGLNHTQVVAANGRSGSSSGYKVTTVNVVGNQVTTSDVPLSASVNNPTQGSQTKWSYSASIYAVKILRDGDEVTAEQQVMVGQRIGLFVSIPPIPGVTPTQTWTVPGEKIKSFVKTGSSNPPSQFQGYKVELPPSDLQQNALSFYWYNGSFAGTQNDVTVVVNIAGQSITEKAKFKVFRPRFTSFTGTYTNRMPAVQYSDGTINLEVDPEKGLTYNASVAVPFVLSSAGQIAYEQFVDLDRDFRGTQDGQPYHVQAIGSDCLDTLDDDPRYRSSPKIIGVGATESVSDYDSPAEAPNRYDDNIQLNDKFKTYLVYRPDGAGSIWIVLAVLNWTFNADANFVAGNNTTPPTWSVTSAIGSGTILNGAYSSIVLGWTKRAQDIKPVRVTP